MGSSQDRDQQASRRFGTSFQSQLGSFTSSSPVAEASIARDIQDASAFAGDDGDDDEGEGDSGFSTPRAPLPEHSMSRSYRRPSAIAAGPRPFALPSSFSQQGYLNKQERAQVEEEETRLLRDSNCLPPKNPRLSSEDNIASRLGKGLSVAGLRKIKSTPDAEAGVSGLPSESSPLLSGAATPIDINKKWEESVLAGKVHTSWQLEAKVLTKYSRSLILTFILQYSLTVASVFSVGHIGKVELGAVSLAGMTANITGYAVYQGLATSLDTLCSQAYGSGRKKLVGLQLQRMVYFLWLATIPIGIIWLCGTWILEAIVPEKETAQLAGLYLKVLLLGAPGYAAFESGKRFVQAQGMFSATLYVLLFCAPANAFMNWLFVWKLGWGFIGAPIAVVVTDNLLPVCLFAYVYFIDGRECWGGFEKRALRNWGPMIRLALPGLVMVLAEFLAFEILTLSASRLSTTHLAAQSVLSTITALTFQIPFPMSIAASTRIANLIGATLADAAKMAAKVALVAAVGVGVLNVALLSGARNHIPQLFTYDADVVALVSGTLPVCAAFQLFDSLATNCNGILRGLGRQEVGGYVNLIAYYGIAMPISFGTCFGLGWGLRGLWLGPAVALLIVAVVEGIFIYRTNWQDAVDDAVTRNANT